MAETTLWGYPASLVLTLDSGNLLRITDFLEYRDGEAVLNEDRVLDALNQAKLRGYG